MMQGVYISVVIAIVVALIGGFVLDPILGLMNLETEVVEIAKEYLIGLSFGIVPLFVYSVLRSFIDALGHTRVTMIITLSSLPINVLFNYLLIFGKFGFPELINLLDPENFEPLRLAVLQLIDKFEEHIVRRGVKLNKFNTIEEFEAFYRNGCEA